MDNKATMCPEINRYVNYVPIAKVKDWGKGTMKDELNDRSKEQEAGSQEQEYEQEVRGGKGRTGRLPNKTGMSQKRKVLQKCDWPIKDSRWPAVGARTMAMGGRAAESKMEGNSGTKPWKKMGITQPMAPSK
jgi:hypothetical protein